MNKGHLVTIGTKEHLVHNNWDKRIFGNNWDEPIPNKRFLAHLGFRS